MWKKEADVMRSRVAAYLSEDGQRRRWCRDRRWVILSDVCRLLRVGAGVSGSARVCVWIPMFWTCTDTCRELKLELDVLDLVKKLNFQANNNRRVYCCRQLFASSARWSGPAVWSGLAAAVRDEVERADKSRRSLE